MPKTGAAKKGKVGRPRDTGAGHVPVVIYLRPDQRDALVELANERPKLRGRATGPVSEIVRELLDKALAMPRRRSTTRG